MNVNLLRVFDVVQFALSGCTAKSVFFFHLVIALCTIPRQFQFIKLKSQNIWAMELTKQESTKEQDVIDPMYLMKNAI